MFCSACGVEIEAALNFCKRCGNRVDRRTSSSIAENLSQSMGYIGGFGLAGLVVGAFMLAKSGLPPEAVVIICFMYLATLFSICFMILRQTSPFSKREQKIQPERTANSEEGVYLKPAATSRLNASGLEPLSVTEHTTKELDEVLRK